MDSDHYTKPEEVLSQATATPPPALAPTEKAAADASGREQKTATTTTKNSLRTIPTESAPHTPASSTSFYVPFNMVEKIRRPVLATPARASIREFIIAFSVYTITGDKRMIDSIVPKVWTLIKGKLSARVGFDTDHVRGAETKSGKDSDSHCLLCLRAACAPPAIDLEIGHFDDIKLTAIGEDDAIQYITDFEVALEELTAAGSSFAKNPHFLQRVFIRNIQHPELQRRLEQSTTTDFKELQTELLTATVDLLLKQRYATEAKRTATAPAPRAAEATPKCPAHPHSTSHTWDECSKNPAVSTARASASTTSTSKTVPTSFTTAAQPSKTSAGPTPAVADPQQAWTSRDETGRLTRSG